jgi:formate dehydrogenase assembly factor FdhD
MGLPDLPTCHAALQARDHRFDGVFFTCVKTTGIYCRPVCPARPPLLKNCHFVATVAEAVAMGFRACKRCRPDAAPGSPAWQGSAASVRRALAALEDRQTLNRLTHALHGAAWADHGGELLLVREDVGRHNALDKLIGALISAGVDPASGFVVITSRCSYEMVEKAAMFGARALVAVSAPTTFAIERAQANAMTLLALARADGAICFTDPAFVTDDLQSEGRRIA